MLKKLFLMQSEKSDWKEILKIMDGSHMVVSVPSYYRYAARGKILSGLLPFCYRLVIQLEFVKKILLESWIFILMEALGSFLTDFCYMLAFYAGLVLS